MRLEDVGMYEYEAGEDFCARHHPVSPPKLLSSSVVEQIRSVGRDIPSEQFADYGRAI